MKQSVNFKQPLILIEDDPVQAARIRDTLMPSYDVTVLGTESELRRYVLDTSKDWPAAVVCDMMLPWSLPSRDMPTPPPVVLKEGVSRAGLRCHTVFRKGEKLVRHGVTVPWVFLSVLEPETVNFKQTKATRYLTKREPTENLLALLKELQQSDPAEMNDTEYLRKMERILREGRDTPIEECESLGKFLPLLAHS